MLSPAELSRLWQKHAPALLLVARGYCSRVADGAAEDCLQEAFIRLARQNPPPESCVAWLMTAVRNAAIDVVRMQKRRKARELTVARDRPAWLIPSETTTANTCTTDQIEGVLQTLDDLTRDVVVAHLWNDMTFRQIADVLKVSSATAHRRYEAGLEQLRARIVLNSQPELNAVGTDA